MKKTLPAGKLPSSLLKKLINELPKANQSIIVPPGVGLDAACIKTGKKLIAVTTDPITFSTKHIATYSVAVNINDIACLGCHPKWFLACLLLPLKTCENELKQIWHNLVTELKRYQIQAVGGHVEITDAVTKPLIVGEMLGETLSKEVLNTKNGRPGDQILLWQNISIEGTAIIATELAHKLNKIIPKHKISKMQKLLYNPGICIWPIVKKIVPTPGLVACHDPTEGGIATALHELADACNCGLKIDHAAIPILPETALLCRLLKLNPLGLLASGSLLILCRKEAVKKILAKAKGEPIAVIGELTSSKQRLLIMQNGKKNILPRFDADEIVRGIKPAP
ncbi:MAG: AIR synthase-related protein [Gammaproteobacteria bacterium]|nr:AIR synthase-related protein [Gammaproteobacteria bacterium]